MNENWQNIIKSILFFGLLILLIVSVYFLKPKSDQKEGFQTTTQYDTVRGTVMTTDKIKFDDINVLTGNVVAASNTVSLQIHAYDRAYYDPKKIKQGDNVIITAVDLELLSKTEETTNNTIKFISTRGNIKTITEKPWKFKAKIVSYTERLIEDKVTGSRYIATMVINNITDVSPDFNANKGTLSYYGVLYNNLVYPQCIGIQSKDDEGILGPEMGDETKYLDNYEIYNLDPPALNDTTPLTQYDKANMLAEFDVSAPIPWDYDLYDQDPKEILWGTVHTMTSKDIFNKCYTRFILGSANNVEYNEVQKAYVYRSPLFGGGWDTPGEIAAIQLAEFYAQYKVGDIVEKITGDNLEKLWRPFVETDQRMMRYAARSARADYLKEHVRGYKKVNVKTRDWFGNLVDKPLLDKDGNLLFDLDGKQEFKTKWVRNKNFVPPTGAKYLDELKKAEDAAEMAARDFFRVKRIARGQGKVLTTTEKGAKGLKKFFEMELNSIKPLKNLVKNIVGKANKVLAKLGIIGRTSAAAKAAKGGMQATRVINVLSSAQLGMVAKALKLDLITKLASKITAKLSIALTKFGIGYQLATKLAWLFASPPLFQVEVPVIVEVGLGIMTIGLVVIVPAIFSAYIPADAICPKDYPFNLADTVEQLDGGGWLWLIITSIPLIGDALGAFAPYICSRKDGGCALKAAPRNPSYFYDSTLSLFFNVRKRGFAEGDAALSNPIQYYEHQMIDNPDKPEKVYTSPEINDPVIWIDYSEPDILDKMGKFYYDMSRKMSQTNSDGSITFEYITKFYGIIGSSQYSCDVQCELEEITYFPFSGKVKCKRKVANPDPMTSSTRYHDRRFYFYVDINAGLTMSKRSEQRANKYLIYEDSKIKYKISGCTHVDGTGVDALEISDEGGYVGDAMISLGDPGSMYNPPRLHVRGSVVTKLLAQAMAPTSIIREDYILDNNNEKRGQGLEGQAAAEWAQEQILKKGENNILVTQASIPPDNTCSVVRSNLLKFGKIVSNPDLGSNVQTRETETFYTQFERDPNAVQWTPISNNSTKIFNVNYIPESSKQRTGTFIQTAITACVGMASPTWGGVSATLASIAGVSDAVACGYQDVLSQSGTYIINGIILTTDERYVINRGPTVDYAPGYTPRYLSDSIANRCSSVNIEVADCTSRYSVRRAVKYYHDKYQDRRIKRIYDISLRRQRSDKFPNGSDQSMCVYNLDFVGYNKDTYEEGTVTTNESVGLIYSQDPDDETCTFKPAYPDTQFTTMIPPSQTIPQPNNVYDNVLTVLPPRDSTLSLRALRKNCKAAAGLYDTCDDVYIQKNVVDMFNYSYNNYPKITRINSSAMTYNAEKDDYPICHYDVNYQYDFGQTVSDRKIISFRMNPSSLRRIPTEFIDRNINTKNTNTVSPHTPTPSSAPNAQVSFNVESVSKFNVGDLVYVFKKPTNDSPDEIVGEFSATVASIAVGTNTLVLKDIADIDTTTGIFTTASIYSIYVLPRQDDLNTCLWDYSSENVKKKTVFAKVPKDEQWIDIPSLPPPVNNNFIRSTCSLKKADGSDKYSQAKIDSYSDCSGFTQISRLVDAFNIKHSTYTKPGLNTVQPSRKILKVFRASTPKLNINSPKMFNTSMPICDYEVEMLRDITGDGRPTSVLNQRETVRFYLKPYDETAGVTNGLFGTLADSIKEYISPPEYKDCLYDYHDDDSDTVNSGYSVSKDSEEILFSIPYVWTAYFMQSANNVVRKALQHYRGYDIEGTLRKTSVQSINITTKILSDVLANSYLGGKQDTTAGSKEDGPVCDGTSTIPGTGTPGTKTIKQQCRDDVMLNSIVNRYNYMNYPPYPGSQFGVEKRKIIEIRRAGVAEPYKCQLLLIEKIEFYKDFTKNAVHAVNITDPDVQYNEKYFERRFQFPVKRKSPRASDNNGRCTFYLDVGNATTRDTAFNADNKDKFTPYTLANNLMDISSNAFAIQSDLSIKSMRFFTVDTNTGAEYDNYFQGINISNVSPNKSIVLNRIKSFYDGINVNTNSDRDRNPKYHRLKKVKAYFHPRPDIIEVYVTVDHAIYNSMFRTWAVKADDNTILVARWDGPNSNTYDIDTNTWTDSPPDSVKEYFAPWIDWKRVGASNTVWKATDKLNNNKDITNEIPYMYYTNFSQFPDDSRISLYNPEVVL